MQGSFAGWCAALALVFVCAWLSAAPRTQAVPAQPVDARQERVSASVARVFDTSVLHRIEITIAPEDARTILGRTSERVRSTFTFDGIVLKDVGVRQAGGTFNLFVPIDGKPTPSMRSRPRPAITTASHSTSTTPTSTHTPGTAA